MQCEQISYFLVSCMPAVAAWRLLCRTNPYTNSNFEAVRVAEFARRWLWVWDVSIHFSKHVLLPEDAGLQRSLGSGSPGVHGRFVSRADGPIAKAVSRVAFHPKIPVVATACDDHTWKMWSVPEGEACARTAWCSIVRESFGSQVNLS